PAPGRSASCACPEASAAPAPENCDSPDPEPPDAAPMVSAPAALAPAPDLPVTAPDAPVRPLPPASPRVTGVTRRNDTAHCLNSGCNDSASTASLVTALMVRYSPCSSFQWKGAKQSPGRTRSSTRTGSTARPRREAISR